MANYALLLNHAPDRYHGLSEDEFMDIIKDYVGWVEDLTEKGIYQGGEKLSDEEGRTLRSVNGKIEVHDSPFSEVTEILGGMMIIKADSYDAAVEIAKTCPHMIHNSHMEIRLIQDVD
jgi:hypothetical protein